MKKIRIFETAVCFLLAVVFCALSVLYAFPALREKTSDSSPRAGIVRLWNIDTFEGGKGSRTSFLNRVSASYEKSRSGVYVMVSSYTAEGATAAFAEGNYPDMISFGVGFSEAAEKCLKINGRNFPGGTVGGECRAIPWCRGGYALFCLEDSFEDVKAENTAVSLGGSNLPLIAAAFLRLGNNAVAEESTTAYVRFLNGKYKYLLGTQRDICRFASREINVYMKPLAEFSDLYQYIAVLTEDKEEKRICDEYVESLLSEKNQKKLTEIGMFSPIYDIYTIDDALADEMEKINARYTLNVFTSPSGLKEVNEAAKSSLAGGNTEVLKNFLKAI